MGRLDGDRILKTLYNNEQRYEKEVGSQDALQDALSRVSIPQALSQEISGSGFVYTEEEDQYILAVLKTYQNFQSSTVDAAEYIAQSLDRSRNAVQCRIRRLHMKTPAEDERGDADNSGEGRDTAASIDSSTAVTQPDYDIVARPGNVHAYTAEETACVRSMYLKYRQAGKRKIDCDAATAARLGRSVSSVNNKVNRLRHNGALPLWENSEAASASEEGLEDTNSHQN
jgi:biotin operon repressor